MQLSIKRHQLKLLTSLYNNLIEWGLALLLSPLILQLAHFLEPSKFQHLGVFIFTVCDYFTCHLLIMKTGQNKRGEEIRSWLSMSFNSTIFKLAAYHSILLLVFIYENLMIPSDGHSLTLGVAAIIAGKELISNLENLSAVSGTNIILDLKTYLISKLVPGASNESSPSSNPTEKSDVKSDKTNV